MSEVAWTFRPFSAVSDQLGRRYGTGEAAVGDPKPAALTQSLAASRCRRTATCRSISTRADPPAPPARRCSLRRPGHRRVATAITVSHNQRSGVFGVDSLIEDVDVSV